MADGVVFLPSFHEAIKDLPDAERLGVYDAVIRYGLYGEIIEMPPVVKSMFALIKPVIDSSQRRYRAAKANGSKGGRPRKNQAENQLENQIQNQDKEKDSERDSERDSEKDTETDKKAGSQPPPTKTEVELFLYQNQIFVNPDRFYAFCEDIGWEKIWDWKNLARSWGKNELKQDSNEFYLRWRMRAREKGLIRDDE